MSFDLLLKRYFVVITFALAALMAYFQARGAMLLVAAALTSLAPPIAMRQTDSVNVAELSRPPRVAAPILARNAFDAVTDPIQAMAISAPPPAQRQDALREPLGAPICECVRASIIAESDDSAWSPAALQGPGLASQNFEE